MRNEYDIEIIAHCWAKTLPVYRTHLKYQLASLINFTHPDIYVCYTVCISRDDEATMNYLHECTQHMPPHVVLNIEVMPSSMLFRRAIARNMRALEACARVYWFTDVDYLFGRNCLVSLLEKVSQISGLTYPRYIKLNPDHATGDRMCETVFDVDKFPTFDERLFVPREQKTCIGGVHIIGVDRLLAINPKTNEPYGYINGHRKCKPVDEADGFRSCRCDVQFKAQHQPALHINIPNVFRIRHTHAGRCYDSKGEREPMKGDHD